MKPNITGWDWITKHTVSTNMAQTNVFMSEEDLERLVCFLLKEGCVLYPDLQYDEPAILKIEQIEDFRDLRSTKSTNLFFVVSERWSVCPLEINHFDKEGRKIYYIHQRSGGPTLDLFAPYPLIQSGQKILLPHGFLAYHPTFWNPSAQSNERIPVELRSMYQRALRILRENSELVVGTKRRYLVASGAKERLMRDALLGPPFNQAQ